MGLEEATTCKAAFKFLQREVGAGFFGSGAQKGFPFTAGSIEDLARVVEDDAVFFACWYFIGNQTLLCDWLFSFKFMSMTADHPTLTQVIKVLPTYYIADGAINAVQNHGTSGSMLLDFTVVLGSIIILFLVAVWALRRQATVVSTI